MSRNGRLSTIALAGAGFALGASAPAQAGPAADIDRAAMATQHPGNLVRRDGRVLLYGQQTNGPDTRNGKWACAKVVTIVLRKAGVPIQVRLGVAGVEQALAGWQRIDDSDELRPGDVVVWTRRWKGNPGGRCTGGGTCHVGIYTSGGYFHNDPLGDSPIFGGIGLLGFKFKQAYRPLNLAAPAAAPPRRRSPAP